MAVYRLVHAIVVRMALGLDQTAVQQVDARRIGDRDVILSPDPHGMLHVALREIARIAPLRPVVGIGRADGRALAHHAGDGQRIGAHSRILSASRPIALKNRVHGGVDGAAIRILFATLRERDIGKQGAERHDEKDEPFVR